MHEVRLLYLIAVAFELLIFVGCEKPGGVQPASRSHIDPGSANTDSALVDLEFPDGTFVDLGESWEYSDVQAQFRLRNISQTSIRFRHGVTTTCGCTSGTLSADVLAPGETATLDLSVNVSAEPGLRKQYTATVHRQLPDGTREDLPFVVVVCSKPVWRVKPESLSVRLSPSEPKDETVFVTGIHGRDVSLESVATTIPGALLDYVAGSISPEGSCRVRISIPPQTPEGHYRIFIRTTDVFVPQKVVPVVVANSSMIRVVPSRVTPQHSDGNLAAKVIVFHPSQTSVEVDESPELSVKVGNPESFDKATLRSIVSIVTTHAAKSDSKIVLKIRFTHADGTSKEQVVEVIVPKG